MNISNNGTKLFYFKTWNTHFAQVIKQNSFKECFLWKPPTLVKLRDLLLILKFAYRTKGSKPKIVSSQIFERIANLRPYLVEGIKLLKDELFSLQ